MNYYAHINEALIHFYFCPKVLDVIFRYFETEDNKGSKSVYCRSLDENKQRLTIRQSVRKPKCWYCGERINVFVKPSKDILYICPDVLNFMSYAYEHDMKRSGFKMEVKIYCRLAKKSNLSKDNITLEKE